ncbi:MAG: sugar ABC transporter ATP-binding protein [Actinomycetota bacterium]|nr:sugar ABC transporter ATP-binding protein [Actinomycetota bacterium]
MTGTNHSLLTARGLSKRYGSVIALRSADLTVEPAEIHALLGANGAGKSTVVKILSAVIAADSGSISVNGEPAHLRRPVDSMKAGIATVFQDPALIPDLTLEQNLRISKLGKDDIRPWLERMNLDDLDFELQVRDVPLAVLRLLDLARALARDPQLLMLDEITAALTTDQAEYVFDVMREWKDRGRSVLFISHRLGEVLDMCDHATILRNGANVADFDLAGVDEAKLVTAMLGQEISEDLAEGYASIAETSSVEQTAAAAGLPVVLEAKDVHLRDRVNGVSFELRRGEILGLTALEGQGQKELFQVLSGDHRPSSGELIINGERLTARSPYDAIRRGVVLVPADRQLALFPQRSVRENLVTPLYNRIGEWFSLASDETERVDRAVDRLDIDVRAGSQVQRLSGGNQQKVTLGRWIASGFDTLLCFDPTRGIDIQTKAQIYDLLRELAQDGAAILLYTSELREIPLVCDRVLVMYNGRFVHEQDASTATEEALLTAAHGLEEASA